MEPPLPQVACQARLESDVRGPHPGSTAGYHHQSQALGGPDRCPAVPSVARLSVSQGIRTPFVEQSGYAALTSSVRISDGGTDYFHGTEYFGLITLVTLVYQVHSVRFFLRACGISVAWLPLVP